MKRLLIFVLFFGGIAWAANNTATLGVLPDSGPALPATCIIGQLYFKTTATTGLSQCTALNTWTVVPLTGGSGNLPSGTGVVRVDTSVGSASELTGDVTTSGSNATTIAALAVSTGKIAASAVTSAKVDSTVCSNAACGQNTTGTSSNVSGTPALPNGTTGTTQSQNDNSAKLSTTAYTDLAVANAVAGVNPAVAVLAASTASLTGNYSNGVSGIGATFTVTATGAFTLDGVSINAIGQRVLLKNQASGFQNGVYTATVVGTVAVSPVFTRALDYDAPSDINSTGAIPVQSGTANASTSWLLTSSVTTVGTDALTYTQFSINPTNIVTATAPGVGLCHFAGSTQACTSSAVVDADVSFTTPAIAGATATTQTAKNNSTKVATTAYVDRPTGLTTGTSITLAAPRQYFICTSTCTITMPVPAAGDEFCVQNNVAVSTVITFAAIGSSSFYGKTDQSAYGTSGTGTLVSSGAAGDKMCLLGVDATHYNVASFNGVWTAN